MRHFKFAKVALMSMVGMSLPLHAAVYDITEIDTANLARHAFPTAINNSGDVALAVNSPILVTDTASISIPEYNIPIDLSLIDFETDSLTDSLTDPDAAQNGNFNLADYQVLLSAIISLQNNNIAQKVVSFQSYKSENGVLEFIPAFDEEDDDFGGYTKGVETRVQDINDAGVMVGISQAKPNKIDFINETGDEFTFVLRDFFGRGFVDLNGTLIGLESESGAAGGYTEAYDINNNLLVAGLEILEPSEALENALDVCDDEEQRGDQPIELCYTSLQDDLLGNHQLRGVLWQLDSDGNVVSKTQLGIPFEPEADDTRLYISRARAVNDNGIAVGSASDFVEDNRDFAARTFAVVFNGDVVESFLDRNEYIGGRTNDINNDNVAVGIGTKVINGSQRTKFFVYDVDSGELTFPDDFFPGSSSVAKAINEVGQVVGEGEVETSLTSNRRRNGFIYDINDGTFQNLNDLIACDSTYTIVQANDINDSGQISALALVNRTQLDMQGNPVLEDDGTEATQDALITVVLNPIPGGNVDDCDTPIDDQQVRSGGSLGAFLVMLFGLVSVRRFKK